MAKKNKVIIGKAIQIGAIVSAEVTKVDDSGMVHWVHMSLLDGLGMPRPQKPEPVEEFLRRFPEFDAEGQDDEH